MGDESGAAKRVLLWRRLANASEPMPKADVWRKK
jgi:hypothetical protein